MRVPPVASESDLLLLLLIVLLVEVVDRRLDLLCILRAQIERLVEVLQRIRPIAKLLVNLARKSRRGKQVDRGMCVGTRERKCAGSLRARGPFRGRRRRSPLWEPS